MTSKETRQELLQNLCSVCSLHRASKELKAKGLAVAIEFHEQFGYDTFKAASLAAVGVIMACNAGLDDMMGCEAIEAHLRSIS